MPNVISLKKAEAKKVNYKPFSIIAMVNGNSKLLLAVVN